MDSCAISVIIPFYNTPQTYFDICLDSILSQTYVDFEIIVVDDGSQDEYREYLVSLKTKDNRINIYHTQNQGVSEARNYGMQMANGKAICFIDADDYIAPWMLEDLWEAFVSYNVDAVVSKYRLAVLDNYDFVRNYKSTMVDNRVLLNTALIGTNCKPDKHGYLSAGPVAVLFRANMAKGLAFPRGIKYMEDVIWNYNFFKKAKKIAVVDECVYAYRQNESSVTHLYKLNMIEDRKNALKIIEQMVGPGNEWYALRVFANYATCCKGIMRTNEIQNFMQRFNYIQRLNKDSVWKAFHVKGIDRNWDQKYKIKKWMAVCGILPFVYCFKKF